MTSDGYSLPEMLVALVLAGLASSGLMVAGRNLARAEVHVEETNRQTRSLERLRRDLGMALRLSGPFTTDSIALRGDSTRLEFDCGGSSKCSAALAARGRAVSLLSPTGAVALMPLRGLASAQWGYVSAQDGRSSSAWPPTDRADRLAAVILLDGAAPIAVFPTVVEQPARCTFDVRIHGCNEAPAP